MSTDIIENSLFKDTQLSEAHFESHLNLDLIHYYEDQSKLKEWLERKSLRDYFHPGIVLGPSKISGYGLFASVKIRKGELISYENSEDYFILNLTEIEAKTQSYQDFWWHFCYQVGDDSWMGPKDPEVIKRKITCFQNHSCDPTTWFVDNDITIIARRDIESGEEITYDYGTTESYIDPEMETVICKCNAGCCRGRMSGEEWKDTNLQSRYGDHWISYLREKIHKIKSTTTTTKRRPSNSSHIS